VGGVNVKILKMAANLCKVLLSQKTHLNQIFPSDIKSQIFKVLSDPTVHKSIFKLSSKRKRQTCVSQGF